MSQRLDQTKTKAESKHGDSELLLRITNLRKMRESFRGGHFLSDEFRSNFNQFMQLIISGAFNDEPSLNIIQEYAKEIQDDFSRPNNSICEPGDNILSDIRNILVICKQRQQALSKASTQSDKSKQPSGPKLPLVPVPLAPVQLTAQPKPPQSAEHKQSPDGPKLPLTPAQLKKLNAELTEAVLNGDFSAIKQALNKGAQPQSSLALAIINHRDSPVGAIVAILLRGGGNILDSSPPYQVPCIKLLGQLNKCGKEGDIYLILNQCLTLGQISMDIYKIACNDLLVTRILNYISATDFARSILSSVHMEAVEAQLTANQRIQRSDEWRQLTTHFPTVLAYIIATYISYMHAADAKSLQSRSDSRSSSNPASSSPATLFGNSPKTVADINNPANVAEGILIQLKENAKQLGYQRTAPDYSNKFAPPVVSYALPVSENFRELLKQLTDLITTTKDSKDIEKLRNVLLPQITFFHQLADQLLTQHGLCTLNYPPVHDDPIHNVMQTIIDFCENPKLTRNLRHSSGGE